MTERTISGRRPDPEPLSLGRRAMYRRVLALLGSQERPFVIGGALGLSLHLGRLIDGELELSRSIIPTWVLRFSAAGSSKPSIGTRAIVWRGVSVLDPRRIEGALADQSSHGGNL